MHASSCYVIDNMDWGGGDTYREPDVFSMENCLNICGEKSIENFNCTEIITVYAKRQLLAKSIKLAVCLVLIVSYSTGSSEFVKVTKE